ncbi:DUF1120 domain-containing protein [Providencia rettgeri]|nr:DUF1120 domain-containing protein [Providencia rettgeri]
MKKVLLASLLSTAAIPALSADSVDISVVGTISSASCTPSAGGGGVVDYGFIKPEALAAKGPTVLSVKTIGFTISCDASANVALRASSNRMGTATDISGPESQVGSALADSALVKAGLGAKQPYGQATVGTPTVVGLGASNGKNIGGYMMNLPPSLVTLDGVAATDKFWTFAAPTRATKWNKQSSSVVTNNGHTIFTVDNAFFGYGTDSEATSPTPFTELAGTLVIQAYITDKANLDLGAPVNLDGSSTIELYYF